MIVKVHQSPIPTKAISARYVPLPSLLTVKAVVGRLLISDHVHALVMLPVEAPQAARFKRLQSNTHYTASVEIETHGTVPDPEETYGRSSTILIPS